MRSLGSQLSYSPFSCLLAKPISFSISIATSQPASSALLSGATAERDLPSSSYRFCIPFSLPCQRFISLPLLRSSAGFSGSLNRGNHHRFHLPIPEPRASAAGAGRRLPSAGGPRSHPGTDAICFSRAPGHLPMNHPSIAHHYNAAPRGEDLQKLSASFYSCNSSVNTGLILREMSPPLLSS